MKKASIVSRIFACLIDLYLAVFITMMMSFVLINWFADNIVSSVLASLLILAAISSIVFKDIVDGRSIGKRIFNIAVRELDSTVPSTKSSLVEILIRCSGLKMYIIYYLALKNVNKVILEMAQKSIN